MSQSTRTRTRTCICISIPFTTLYPTTHCMYHNDDSIIPSCSGLTPSPGIGAGVGAAVIPLPHYLVHDPKLDSFLRSHEIIPLQRTFKSPFSTLQIFSGTLAVRGVYLC